MYRHGPELDASVARRGEPRESAGSPGKQTLVEVVQRREAAAMGTPPPDDAAIRGVAARGVEGPREALPFRAQIQRLFGHHDVSDISAHTGGAAAQATQAIGATAYATGNHVAFGSAPDLHTAAHEAAHVVQQRAGVHLKGGVGAEGDSYEQHADAVADRVVAGRSAVDLLDTFASAGSTRRADGPVQAKLFVKNAKIKRAFGASAYREVPQAPGAQAGLAQGGLAQGGLAQGGPAQGASTRDDLIDDPVRSYYFHDEAELAGYLAGTTTTIGFVGDQFVRLPGTLLVLGEVHNEQKFLRLVTATRTTQYAYEGITAGPTDQYNQPLLQAMDQRVTDIGWGGGLAAADNAGEAFLPKMIRMLAEVRFEDGRVQADATGRRALCWAVLYARGDTGRVRTSYATHQILLDALLQNGGDVAGIAANQPSVHALQLFVATFISRAHEVADEERAGMGMIERRKFAAGRDASDRYADIRPSGPNRLADKGDDARDLSMFRAIEAAKSSGKLLYCMGESHRLRLAPMLDARRIPHMHIDDFLAQQVTKYPQ